MHGRRSSLLCALLMVGACLFLFQVRSYGQGANHKKINFNTVDGVEIKGTFYPSAGKAPAVLLLHALGEDSRKKNWVNLAEELQKNGFAVLTFDFRGHGESTT